MLSASLAACCCGLLPLQANAIVALFSLMTVNNWPILMEGCVAATNTGARLFFIAYYGVTVTLVLNVLVRVRRDGPSP